MPLIVLTAEKSSLFEGADTRRQWLEFQRDLASQSPRSHHEVVTGSGHFIHKRRPDAVVEAIRTLVDGAPAHAPSR